MICPVVNPQHSSGAAKGFLSLMPHRDRADATYTHAQFLSLSLKSRSSYFCHSSTATTQTPAPNGALRSAGSAVFTLGIKCEFETEFNVECVYQCSVERHKLYSKWTQYTKVWKAYFKRFPFVLFWYYCNHMPFSCWTQEREDLTQVTEKML